MEKFFMKKRLDEKGKEIEKYLEELASCTPETIEEYTQDYKSKAACERYFEKIIEAIVDLGFLVIKEKNLRTPEDDKEIFDILCDNKIISLPLAERLKDAKGMRNILAHQYGIVDDEKVFQGITRELSEDAEQFLVSLKKSRKPQ